MKLELKIILALIIVPGIAFILSFGYLDHGPYYLGLNSDPEYAYLFNSLNILNGIIPSHIDHPGTPLQLMGAMVLFVKGLVTSSTISITCIQQSVLQNPEMYLRAINLLINFLIFTTISISSLKLFLETQYLLPALTLQFSLFCFYSIPLALGRVSPEPLLIVSSFLLFYFLVNEFTKNETCDNEILGMARPISAGCAIAFGIALKITFIPLVFFVLCFDTLKKKILTVASCIFFFVIFTLPILPKYSVLFGWFKSIAIHKETYGHGQVGIPAISNLLANLEALAFREPVLFLLLAIYFLLAVLLTQKSSEKSVLRKKTSKLLWIGCLIISSQIAVTVKHPGAHYMLPAMVSTCFINSVLVYFLFKESHNTKKLIGISFLFFLGITFFFNAKKIDNWVSNNRENVLEAKELLAKSEAIRDTLKVGFYRSSLPEFALSFGNDWSGNHYGKILSDLYSNVIFYNIWDQSFYSFNGPIISETLTTMFDNYTNILLIGSNSSIASVKMLKFEPYYTNKIEGIYHLQR